MYYSKSLSFTWNCSPEDKTFTLTEPSSHSVFPTSISLLAFIRAALLNTHFSGLLSNTKSTVWPLLLRAVATVAAAPWRSFSKAHTMFSTSCPSSGNKFFSLSSYVEEGNKGVRYSHAKTELFTAHSGNGKATSGDFKLTSTITASPKPKPQAGMSSPPYVGSNLSYLPPPHIARRFPFRSNPCQINIFFLISISIIKTVDQYPMHHVVKANLKDNTSVIR